MGNRQYGMNQLGDLGLMGIAYDKGDAGEGGNFFGRALGVAAGNEDARSRIGGVYLRVAAAARCVSGSRNGAGVENHDVGHRGIGSGRAALFEELALNDRAISLGGSAAELLDEEGAHWRSAPEFYLSTRAHPDTEAVPGNRFTTRKGAYTISGFHDTHKKKSIPTG